MRLLIPVVFAILFSGLMAWSPVHAQRLACGFQNTTIEFEEALFDMVAVDFDDDQDIDLVIEKVELVNGQSVDRSLLFLENDGIGNFIEVLDLDRSVGKIDLVDIDSDGDVDIVSLGLQRLTIHINDGNLNFAQPVSYFFQTAGVDLTNGPMLGDVDNDGDMDIAVSTNDSLFGFTPQVVEFFINDGNGVFTEGPLLAVPSRASGGALVDLDNDSDLDAVISAWDGVVRSAFVFANDGSGSFSGPVEYPSNVWAAKLCVADIDNDSNLDLIGNSSARSEVLFGNGDGSLSRPLPLGEQFGIYRKFYGVLDVNDDGFQEIISIRGLTNSVTLNLNSDGRSFTEDLDVVFDISPNTIRVADFNGDGRQDAAICHSGGKLEILYFDCGMVLFGDINLDGSVTLLDVAVFVDLLISKRFQIEADINRDGTVDLLDIGPFVDLLIG